MINEHKSPYCIISEDGIPEMDQHAEMLSFADYDRALVEAVECSRAFPNRRFWVYKRVSPTIRTLVGPTRITHGEENGRT